ncbi:GMP synthase subunit A [Caldivirga sp. UBA161]|uniref:GMP synthase subunit A n=1 Tax=Caldivirga sp. UBA161 TaxID=1915569 RepID=UPI0025BEBC99|nr:GMP synthase subunit A [Caldivirga sp. UBA161]
MNVIGVVNFGGQYNHLIKRRLEDLGFQAKLINPNEPLHSLSREFNCLIISGGSWNIPIDIPKLGNAPKYVLEFPGPILGICLGHQLIAYEFGGMLGNKTPEFGGVRVRIDDEDTILRGVGAEFTAWESHNVSVDKEPDGFMVLAHSDLVRVQAMANPRIGRYSVQFHPEVKHTEFGGVILRNFAELCS